MNTEHIKALENVVLNSGIDQDTGRKRYDITFGPFTASLTEVGEKLPHWKHLSESHNLKQHHLFTITHNKMMLRVDYWLSIAKPLVTDVGDIFTALSCALDEASYTDIFTNIDEMAEEFGITKPSEALRIWTQVNEMAPVLAQVFEGSGWSTEEIHQWLHDQGY